jgi:hypothetical protein
VGHHLAGPAFRLLFQLGAAPPEKKALTAPTSRMPFNPAGGRPSDITTVEPATSFAGRNPFTRSTKRFSLPP